MNITAKETLILNERYRAEIFVLKIVPLNVMLLYLRIYLTALYNFKQKLPTDLKQFCIYTRRHSLIS